MSVGLVVGNRYALTARIGRGGFGSVWQARDTTLRRDVAVKLVEVAPEDSDIVARFSREAQAVASLNHPNIVIAHDFGVVDSAAYLVMELVDGGSLADELATRRMADEPPLDVARIVTLGTQIAAGLAAAHAAGLVHRDLKPANIMVVRATGAVKIVDFGIAHISDLSRLTKPGGYLGTLPYASPEQMGDGPVDGRSDLYSLGCLLYELVTDHSPYVAESPAQWIAAHQSATPIPIRSYAPGISVELESLIHALLAKDPARRPADAETVRARLAHVPRTAPTLIDSAPIDRPLAGASPVALPGSPAAPVGAQPLRPVYAPGRASTPPAPVADAPVVASPVGAPVPVKLPVRPAVQARPRQAFAHPVGGPVSPGAPSPGAVSPGRPPVGGGVPIGGVPVGGVQPRPVPAGPGVVHRLPQAPVMPRYPLSPGWAGGPAVPYAPQRPASLTLAGWILVALAGACVLEAFVIVAAAIPVGQAASRAFAGVSSAAGAGVIGAMVVAVVCCVGAAVVVAILGASNLRGSRAGRIWTWVLGAPSLLWVLGASGTKDVATLAATPSGQDLERPRVVVALGQVRAAVPPWLGSLSHLFDVLAMVALLSVIILIALPSSNGYVRARRALRR